MGFFKKLTNLVKKEKKPFTKGSSATILFNGIDDLTTGACKELQHVEAGSTLH
eukprot:Awhi_evm1s3997